MSLKVLLIFHSNTDKKVSIEKLPPLGILSIASYLEKMGIHTDVIDFTIDPKAQIRAEEYDLIGFSINISNREISLKEILNIKNKYPEKRIVVGGPLCLSNPDLFALNEYIDAVFVCEGEHALYEYITFQNKDAVKGIFYRRETEMVYTGDRPWIDNLDSLPFPAFNKVNLKKYNNFPKKKRPLSSMITSRGCPYNCIFCSHSMGKKWRPRSAENVAKEIMWQISEFGVKEILIYDDNFSLNRKRAEKICDLIVEQKLKIKIQFSNGLRADNLDLSLLKKIKKAGTWLMGIAPEVGNPEVMKKIKKGFDHKKVIEIRELCRKVGIKTHGFFMIGFPFENKNTIKDTINFAKKIDCEIVEFNKVIPYAKTELYDLLIKHNNLLEDPITNVKSYHEGTIITHKVGELKDSEIKELIRKAYREYYLRPRKMIDLLKTFSFADLLGLSLYAIRTRNI